MADSPELKAVGPVRVSIHCAGAAQESLPLVSVRVHHAYNQLPWARLVLADGDMAQGKLALSDGELFKPGANIEVKAGYGEGGGKGGGDTEASLFTGTVVRHGFKLSGNNDSRLIVECRASAGQMTLSRHTAQYVDQTDGDIIQQLLAHAGLGASVAATSIRHKALVQYDCSDWDFMLSRANAAGLLVSVDGGTVSVQPPQLQLAAALNLAWGRDLIDFDADIDAALAGVRGHMSFQGSALAKPGALVELEGLGKRFSGTVLLSSVEHEIADGNWISRVGFGLGPEWHVQQPRPLAGVGSLQIGVVLKLDGDPEGEHRVQVRLPASQAATEGIWARLLQPQASSGFGSFFVPEVGDEVLLGHLNQDPSHPVVLGSPYSSRHAPPFGMTAENPIKAIVTRSRHRIEFNDADQRITVTTPAQNRLVFSDHDQSIVIQDQNGNSVKLSEAGIALDSPKDIVLTAQGSIRLAADKAISLQAKADVKLDGLNIACQAQVGVTARGNTSAELSASGQTTVKGALVMIN
jgi:uncharacterized protein involved in type VI secretion and phage assembly